MLSFYMIISNENFSALKGLSTNYTCDYSKIILNQKWKERNQRKHCGNLFDYLVVSKSFVKITKREHWIWLMQIYVDWRKLSTNYPFEKNTHSTNFDPSIDPTFHWKLSPVIWVLILSFLSSYRDRERERETILLFPSCHLSLLIFLFLQFSHSFSLWQYERNLSRNKWGFLFIPYSFLLLIWNFENYEQEIRWSTVA